MSTTDFRNWPPEADKKRKRGRKNAVLAWTGIVFLLSVLGGIGFFAATGRSLWPPTIQIMGPPLHVMRGGQEQVLVLTSTIPGGRRRAGVLHLDLAAYDMLTGQQLWLKRVRSERGGAATNKQILGAQGDAVWLLLDELTAVSVAGGETVATQAQIESNNPELKGRLTLDEKSFRMNQGLVITAADGSYYRLRTPLGRVEPVTKLLDPSEEDRTPAQFAPSYIGAYRAAGAIFGNRWIGTRTSKGLDDPGGSNRFWRSELIGGELPSDAGAFERSNITSYLPGSLNRDGRSLNSRKSFLWGSILLDPARKQAVKVANPDSVLVQTMSRIDDDGLLQLARVDLDGRVLWEREVPLSRLQSVMAGEKRLALFGIHYNPNRPKVGDPYHTARTVIVSLDAATGDFQTVSVFLRAQ
ncbi:MAG: hypothetical protein K2X35_01695 [Bryobacteraceae bacterium]|nr:hypothetical protein [Bryobacteraceae bacterium]